MLEEGFQVKRINYLEGYDLGSKRGTTLLKNEIKFNPPKFSWVSLPCTRLSSLNNLTQRSPEEWARFEQRQHRDLKRAEEVGDALCDGIEKRPEADMAWEWPTGATKGWKSRAIKRIVARLQKLGKKIYWCSFHGCAYGLEFKGLPVQKSWTVMTTNKNVWLALQRKCPGHAEHLHCRGEVAQASSYYPPKMVKAVTKAVITSWTEPEDTYMTSLATDVEQYLLEIPHDSSGHSKVVREVREEDPAIMALSRTNFPSEPPKGRKLELIKQQMMRIHRSSGHASFSNLQRLLRMRRAPQWSIDLAGSLQCPDCLEAQRPQPQPPASTKPMPELWEIVGTDVFEYEFGEVKHKFVLWRDRASGYAYIEHLQEYQKSWEPKTQHIIASLIHWLMVNPCPTWIMSDAGTIYTSEEFLHFASRSGIGVLTAPAEAHWVMGPEEGCIGILKNSVTRIMKEHADLTVPQAFALAVHGHNSAIGPSGYSPFQWTRGACSPQEDLLPGLNPKKVFGGLLKLREDARLAVEKEAARYRMSKLGNSVTRPPAAYKTGALVMLWRQRMKPGKTTGHWTGPHRVLLQEGSTLWLAHGATLVRAKTNQVRAITRREELEATVNGAAIYRHPVTVDSLLKEFTGKHYTNVTGEVPSTRQMAEDVTAADVQIEARPSKISRRTWPQGAKRKDHPEDADDEEPPQVAPKTSKEKSAPSCEETPEAAPQTTSPPNPNLEDIPGEAIPQESLEEALKKRGPNVVDGIPPTQDVQTGNSCPVSECTLPGGHSGPHEDETGNKFTWTPYGGRISLEEDSNQGDSSSSEELVSTPRPTKAEIPQKAKEEGESIFCLEIEVNREDIKFLEKRPHKATVWMSKKMAEKSKEHQWSQLSVERKKDFDMAQATELSNVLQSRALRCLTTQEWENMDWSKVMQMRWVLTTKSGGAAKGRLVVLGYQAHNLTSVQTSAPTMARTSRNTLLMTCANRRFRVRAGDVTSAFLQAPQDLEQEELYVWAPSELAVLFGAPPSNPVLPLKIRRAFYGLVHAPRLWHEHVAKTLLQQGWQRLASDRCVFILLSDSGELIGVAGLHVDDFLIGGQDGHEKFEAARKALEGAFRWGKWEEESFTFAGCKITQANDFTIKIDQNEYTEKWIDEIEIPKERGANPKLLATPEEITQLRGVIGSVAWRSSQSSPQYQADVGLLLSEVPYATVGTLQRANKIVRELKRTPQHLIFPSWHVDWRELCVVVWADASNSNRPDRGSTMGIIAGCAPRSILEGEEQQVALLNWKSSKTPRQTLGSNGAEVQSITEGEDMCFRLRGLIAEIHGMQLERRKVHEMVRDNTHGAIIMDSKGIFDSMKNTSALHGLRSSRAGYELTISINQAKMVNTHLRWVNGHAMLADSLTKGNSRHVILQFLASGQRWRLIFDEKFVSGKRLRKQELERMAAEEQAFVAEVRKMAIQQRYPWTDACAVCLYFDHGFDAVTPMHNVSSQIVCDGPGTVLQRGLGSKLAMLHVAETETRTSGQLVIKVLDARSNLSSTSMCPIRVLTGRREGLPMIYIDMPTPNASFLLSGTLGARTPETLSGMEMAVPSFGFVSAAPSTPCLVKLEVPRGTLVPPHRAPHRIDATEWTEESRGSYSLLADSVEAATELTQRLRFRVAEEEIDRQPLVVPMSISVFALPSGQKSDMEKGVLRDQRDLQLSMSSEPSIPKLHIQQRQLHVPRPPQRVELAQLEMQLHYPRSFVLQLSCDACTFHDGSLSTASVYQVTGLAPVVQRHVASMEMEVTCANCEAEVVLIRAWDPTAGSLIAQASCQIITRSSAVARGPPVLQVESSGVTLRAGESVSLSHLSLRNADPNEPLGLYAVQDDVEVHLRSSQGILEVDVAALVGSSQAYLSDAKDGAATATKYDQEQEQVADMGAQMSGAAFNVPSANTRLAYVDPSRPADPENRTLLAPAGAQRPQMVLWTGRSLQLRGPAALMQATLATLKYTADERAGGWDTVQVAVGTDGQRGEVPLYIVRKAGDVLLKGAPLQTLIAGQFLKPNVTFEYGSLVRPTDVFNAWVTCNSCGFALWAFAGEMEAVFFGTFAGVLLLNFHVLVNKSDLNKGGALLWSLLRRLVISPSTISSEEEIQQKQRVEEELHKMRLWVFTQKLAGGFNGW
eukprot:s669_g4.t2